MRALGKLRCGATNDSCATSAQHTGQMTSIISALPHFAPPPYGVGAGCAGAVAGAVAAGDAPASTVDACWRVVDITKTSAIAEMSTAKINGKSPLLCPTSGSCGSVDISLLP